MRVYVLINLCSEDVEQHQTNTIYKLFTTDVYQESERVQSFASHAPHLHNNIEVEKLGGWVGGEGGEGVG